MINVFRIELDPDSRYFLLADQHLVRSDALRFDCTRVEEWQPPAVYVYEPKLRAGDFWGFQMQRSTFAIAPRVHKLVEPLLCLAGQLLPLPYEDQVFHLLNVTECVNCLDQSATEWVYGKSTGKRIDVEKYVFHADRLPESSVFKIPETASSEILCYEGLKDPEDEFKPSVELQALTGLRFHKLWSSE